ncbi:hypothetical protein F5Y19DRAFT_479614 [Xylariaceae sp. FL1651]|nr:hypothetical protein F5Y19DRAFT_479614 [Xylariaceae sp. FL1651]
MRISAEQPFIAGWVEYDRGSGACNSGERGDADAVFLFEAGATLKNIIIGGGTYPASDKIV